MPRVVHTGLDGQVTGLPFKVSAWTGVRSFEDLDQTGFGTTEKERLKGLGDFVGSVVAYVASGTTSDDPTTLLTNGTVASLVLTSRTGCTFTFAALIRNIDFREVDINGRRAQMAVFEFAKTGSLTTTWATS